MVGQAAAQDGDAFWTIMDAEWEIDDGVVEMKAGHGAASSGANDGAGIDPPLIFLEEGSS
jgi:hypothetical protein